MVFSQELSVLQGEEKKARSTVDSDCDSLGRVLHDRSGTGLCGQYFFLVQIKHLGHGCTASERNHPEKCAVEGTADSMPHREFLFCAPCQHLYDSPIY